MFQPVNLKIITNKSLKNVSDFIENNYVSTFHTILINCNYYFNVVCTILINCKRYYLNFIGRLLY